MGWEDPLEKEMTTYSSILAWKIPWTEEAGGLQSMGLQRLQRDLVTQHVHKHMCIYLNYIIILVVCKLFVCKVYL